MAEAAQAVGVGEFAEVGHLFGGERRLQLEGDFHESHRSLIIPASARAGPCGVCFLLIDRNFLPANGLCDSALISLASFVSLSNLS